MEYEYRCVSVRPSPPVCPYRVPSLGSSLYLQSTDLGCYPDDSSAGVLERACGFNGGWGRPQVPRLEASRLRAIRAWTCCGVYTHSGMTSKYLWYRSRNMATAVRLPKLPLVATTPQCLVAANTTVAVNTDSGAFAAADDACLCLCFCSPMRPAAAATVGPASGQQSKRDNPPE